MYARWFVCLLIGERCSEKGKCRERVKAELVCGV